MRQEYLLDNRGIDEISSQIEEWLLGIGTSRPTIIRLRMTMEELLIRISGHFGEECRGTLITGKRFGTPVLRFRYRGEEFDPTLIVPSTEEKASEEETGSGSESGSGSASGIAFDAVSGEDLTRMLLVRLGMTPVWSYRRGENEIRLQGPGRTIRSETRLAAAAVLAILLGLAGGFLPAGITETAVQFVLEPVSAVFMNVLNTFIGLMVFLSVLTGICSVGSVSDFSKMGRSVILSTLRNTFLCTGICMVLMLPFFRYGNAAAAGGGSQINEIADLLFSIFPSDPVSPFQKGDMRQIVFMSVLAGCALLVLEERAAYLKQFMQQLSLLINQIVQGICSFLPLYIFASLVAMLWENGTGIFARLWKPMIVYLLMALLMIIGKTIWTSMRLHVRPQAILSAIKSSALIGLTTASSSAALGTMLETNEKKLGIPEKISRFGTTISCLFVAGSHGTIFAVILFYLAEHYGMSVNAGWLVTAWVLCSLFSLAIPPVSGGMLVVVGMLMVQLDIPQDGLAVAGLISMILDFIGTGTRICITHEELMLQANHLKIWDRRMMEEQ